jgi:hypothetical protein
MRNKFIPVKELMWLSEVNDGPVQLTDYAQSYRHALIYALCDSENCTVSLESEDGIVETFWLKEPDEDNS